MTEIPSESEPAEFVTETFEKNRGRSRWSLALLAAVLALISAGAGLLIQDRFEKSVRAELIDRGRSVAWGILLGVEAGRSNGGSKDLQAWKDALEGTDGVAYIVAKDEKGTILYHTFDSEVPEALSGADGSNGDVRRIDVLGKKGVLDVRVPVRSDQWAVIHVGMDPAFEQKRLNGVRTTIWVAVCLCAVFSFAVTAFFYYFLTVKPLGRIAGNGGKRIDLPFGEEQIRTISRLIGERGRELRKCRSRIGSMKDEIEQRQQEFQNQKEALQKAQAQMIRSEKFASMGQIAASVAHEISNPLAGILTYLKLIRRKLESGKGLQDNKDVYRQYLLTMERETERCGHIVKNLLDFARGSDPDLREIQVHRVLEDTLFLLNFKLLTNDVLLEKDFGEVPPVLGDFGQLKQVFLNVIINAIEAMKTDERILRIRTRYHQESGSVLVEFQDSGEGIPQKDIHKVFDPFYTTKPGGTGMGLAVLYSILEKHNADINIDSEPGKGTKVTIQLNATQ